MSSFFRHSKLVACKFVFDINVISLVQSPLSGRMVLIKWQRGSKRSGTTKRVIISSNTASFQENMEVKATLYKDAKKGKFDPKVLDLLIIEPKEKKECKLGVCSVDLALCAVNLGSESSHMLSIEGGELAGAILKVSIRGRLRHGADGEGSVGSTVSETDHGLEHSGKYEATGNEAASNASDELQHTQGSDDDSVSEPPGRGSEGRGGMRPLSEQPARTQSARDDSSKKGGAAAEKTARPSAAGALLRTAPAADASTPHITSTTGGVPRVTSASGPNGAAPLGMLAALKAKQVGLVKAVDDADAARSGPRRGSKEDRQLSSDDDEAAVAVAAPQAQPKPVLKPSGSSDKLSRLSSKDAQASAAAASRPAAEDAASSRDKTHRDSKAKLNAVDAAAAAATQRSVMISRQEDAAAVKTTFDARQSSDLVNAAYETPPSFSVLFVTFGQVRQGVDIQQRRRENGGSAGRFRNARQTGERTSAAEEAAAAVQQGQRRKQRVGGGGVGRQPHCISRFRRHAADVLDCMGP